MKVLLDFDDAADFACWRPVDDVVMGGTSRSALRPLEPGVASFSGIVSLEHGGGFASVRTEPQAWATRGARAFALRCLGDGHTYKFTLRVDDGFDGVQYQARFVPPRGTWTELRLPVDDFVPTYRGHGLRGIGPLAPEQVRRIGLMISDRQAGPLELLVDWIGVED